MKTAYNEIVEFKDWLWEKFYEWRGKTTLGVTDFSAYLDIKQPTITAWMKGEYNPRGKNLVKLGEKYPDVYEVLGFVRLNEGELTMDQLLPEDRAALVAALAAAGLPVVSDADLERALVAFETHGIKVIRKH